MKPTLVDSSGKTLKKEDKRQWEEKVTECAQQFSQAMEERFVGAKMRAENFLPKPHTPEVLSKATEVFIDYLIGTTVAILCNGQPADSQFEEIAVEVFRDKFSRLREMSKRPI